MQPPFSGLISGGPQVLAQASGGSEYALRQWAHLPQSHRPDRQNMVSCTFAKLSLCLGARDVQAKRDPGISPQQTLPSKYACCFRSCIVRSLHLTPHSKRKSCRCEHNVAETLRETHSAVGATHGQASPAHSRMQGLEFKALCVPVKQLCRHRACWAVGIPRRGTARRSLRRYGPFCALRRT